MPYIAPPFTPSVTISGTDLIRNTDEKLQTIANDVGDYLETQTQEALTELEDTMGGIEAQFDVINSESNGYVTQALNAKNQAETAETAATTQAGIATTKANEAATSAAVATAKANLATSVVIPTTASYNNTTQDWRDSMMSKAQFNALASERRVNMAGSGVYELDTTLTSVNTGIATRMVANTFIHGNARFSINGVVNRFLNQSIIVPNAPTVLPYDATLTPEQIASGVIKHADSSNSGLIVNGKFDTDTSGWSTLGSTFTAISGVGTLVTNGTGYARQAINTIIGKKYTAEFNIISGVATAAVYIRQVSNNTTIASSVGVTSGVVSIEFTAVESTTYILLYLNVAGTATFDNIAVYPSDAISRSDLVFLESWHEDVNEKDFVYPLGNVQYLGTTGDSGTPVAGAFAGSGTYSLFGNWQASGALVGKGYVWSALSDANKKAFVANPENNIYLDGATYVQVRYRVRVVQGCGDSWANVNSILSNNASGNVTLKYGTFGTYSLGGTVKPKGKKVTSNEISEYSEGMYMDMGNINSDYNKTGLVYIGAFSACNLAWGLDYSFGYEGKCYALPIALVHRRNQGAYHQVYNPNGSNKHTDAGNTGGKFWYDSSAIQGTTLSQMFTKYNVGGVLSTSERGSIASAQPGRPDGLFYDQVHESDILDLRMSSQKVEDYNRLIDREFNKLVAGTYRGQQGELNTEVKTQTTTGTVATVEVNDGTKYKSGDVIYIYDLTSSAVKGRFVVKSISTNTLTVDSAFAKLANSYMISGGSTTRTKSNTITITDLIGSPSNLPVNMKLDGQSFNTLHTAEDGTILLPTGVLTVFKLSRKANATPLQVLKSTNSGATWTALTVTTHYTFSTVTNAITMVSAPATTDLIMVTYKTHTNMAVAGVNSEVLAIGDVWATSDAYNQMSNTLISKTTIGAGQPYHTSSKLTFSLEHKGINTESAGKLISYNDGVIPRHSSLSLGASISYPAVKVFPYLTRTNGKARLQLVFKEMKYTTTWGDDSKFNIVDNVSTTTDNNAQTVLIGQKYCELPYFISAGE